MIPLLRSAVRPVLLKNGAKAIFSRACLSSSLSSRTIAGVGRDHVLSVRKCSMSTATLGSRSRPHNTGFPKLQPMIVLKFALASFAFGFLVKSFVTTEPPVVKGREDYADALVWVETVKMMLKDGLLAPADPNVIPELTTEPVIRESLREAEKERVLQVTDLINADGTVDVSRVYNTRALVARQQAYWNRNGFEQHLVDSDHPLLPRDVETLIAPRVATNPKIPAHLRDRSAQAVLALYILQSKVRRLGMEVKSLESLQEQVQQALKKRPFSSVRVSLSSMTQEEKETHDLEILQHALKKAMGDIRTHESNAMRDYRRALTLATTGQEAN